VEGSSTDTMAVLLASDTIFVDPTTLSFGGSRVSTGSGTTCTRQSGLQNTDLNSLFGGDTPACTPVVISSAFSGAFTVPAGVNADLSSIAFSNSKESGEIFVDTDDPLHVPSRSLTANKKIAALLQSIHATLRRR
jgi:hypothetical protein